jgi:U4/U6 small nuclear ribonucleoprotein PRP31
MSTDADDLLNDFGDSGDEVEEENNNDGLIRDPEASGDRDRDAMELDGEAEAKNDDDPDANLNDRDDSEATKVKVERMQLGGVKDVRSVASLMQTLEPVLEVSTCIPISFFFFF